MEAYKDVLIPIISAIIAAVTAYRVAITNSKTALAINESAEESRFHGQILEYSDQIRSDLTSLREENKKLKAELDSAILENKRLKEKAIEMESLINRLMDSRAELANQIIKLESQIHELR